MVKILKAGTFSIVDSGCRKKAIKELEKVCSSIILSE
jgi:hypothetical protein